VLVDVLLMEVCGVTPVLSSVVEGAKSDMIKYFQ
jgi:hypothetical protein